MLWGMPWDMVVKCRRSEASLPLAHFLISWGLNVFIGKDTNNTYFKGLL